jgi:hypothetical protein
MDNLIGLVNRIQRACTALGDHGGEGAVQSLWESLPSVVVVGGQVCEGGLTLLNLLFFHRAMSCCTYQGVITSESRFHGRQCSLFRLYTLRTSGSAVYCCWSSERNITRTRAFQRQWRHTVDVVLISCMLE